MKIRTQRDILYTLQNRKVFIQPLSLLDRYYYKLDMNQNRLMYQVRQFDNYKNALYEFESDVKHKLALKLSLTKMQLNQTQPQISRNLDRLLRENEQHLSSEINRLIQAQQDMIILKKVAFNDILKAMKHLNPFEIMSRGYGALFHDKVAITSINQVSVNDIVDIRLKDGHLKAIIQERKLENE